MSLLSYKDRPLQVTMGMSTSLQVPIGEDSWVALGELLAMLSAVSSTSFYARKFVGYHELTADFSKTYV